VLLVVIGNNPGIGSSDDPEDGMNTNYYISPEYRIAVFDNDGTMWSEKPKPIPF